MKHESILSKLKSQVKLIESIITEGDHWPKDYRRKAINRIKLATSGKTPVYNENVIEQDVDKMMGKFKELLHKNSNVGYFLPVIRMFIDYAGNDQDKRKEFLGSENSENSKIDMIVSTLDLISHDPSLEAKFKDDIKNRWTLEDFEKAAAELHAEIDKNDADSLASVGSSESTDYEVILIKSYEELHEKFGGNKTGYKGKSEWCHTNGKSTYDSWTETGTKQFFVLAKKGWENIQPPDPKTTNAFDEYGTSLIAILVKVDDCELLNATLRWNHVINPSGTIPKTRVDRAFLGWGDLSKVVGFNVKAIVEKEIKEQQDKLKNKIEKVNKEIYDKLKTVTEITQSTFTQDEKRFIIHLDIPTNVTSIGKEAVAYCDGLTSITIPDSVTSIGEWAFNDCKGLTSVTIGNSVTSIGEGAFAHCDSLTSMTIPKSVTSIGSGAFSWCTSLTQVTIPDSVANIGRNAFTFCHGITSITIPNSVTRIEPGMFIECINLKNVTIPDSVTSIGKYAFHDCRGLTNITIPDSVTNIGDSAFWRCSGLKTITFKGKTIDEVRSMANYPWKINDPEEVITVEAGND